MNNGKYVFGLGDLGRWLATEAERLGVDVFTSSAAAEVKGMDISSFRCIEMG